jgi:type VI secretion system secreted protein Hcp
MPETKNPQKEQFGHHERISILYSKITWLYPDGNIEYTDSWTAER